VLGGGRVVEAANDRNRHLESAAAWQRIIDKLTVSEDA
jgi:hypothetical protein